MKKHKKHPCFSKRSYSNLDAVKDGVAWNYLRGKNALRYYECPLCLDFHLTSKNTRKPKIESKRLHRLLRLKSTKELIKTRMQVLVIGKQQKARLNILPLQKQKDALRRLNRPHYWDIKSRILILKKMI